MKNIFKLIAVGLILALVISLGVLTIFADEETAIDLTDPEQASEYVDGYADNLTEDPNFEENIDTAIDTVRESNPYFATLLSILPQILPAFFLHIPVPPAPEAFRHIPRISPQRALCLCRGQGRRILR